MPRLECSVRLPVEQGQQGPWQSLQVFEIKSICWYIRRASQDVSHAGTRQCLTTRQLLHSRPAIACTDWSLVPTQQGYSGADNVEPAKVVNPGFEQWKQQEQRQNATLRIHGVTALLVVTNG